MKSPAPGTRLVLLLLLLALVPFFLRFDEYLISVIIGALLIGVMGQAWSLMARCGMVSLGHAAFFGLGAYGAAAAAIRGMPAPVCIGLGGLLATIFSLAFIGLSGRLRGAYFALATLVIAAVPKGAVLNWEAVTGGAVGLFGVPPLTAPGAGAGGPPSRVMEYYVLFAIVCMVLTVGWWIIHRTSFGLASSALRQDERAAGARGVSPLRFKMTAILLSAAFTGCAGGFYALQVRYLEPHYIFSLHFSVIPMVVAIFGGLSATFGPLLGALILQLADELVFRRIFLASHDVLYGLTLMGTILLCPRGIFNVLFRWRNKRC